MSGDDEKKPVGRFNWGPMTAPQNRCCYHGQGGSPVMRFNTGPFGWIVSADYLIPHDAVSTGMRRELMSAAAIEGVEGYHYNSGAFGGDVSRRPSHSGVRLARSWESNTFSGLRRGSGAGEVIDPPSPLPEPLNEGTSRLAGRRGFKSLSV